MGAWSIAWRVHDAQFWGVPQRRRRISLVADFGGMSAPEILFERKGLPGYLTQGSWTWEASSGCFAARTVVPDQEEPNLDGNNMEMCIRDRERGERDEAGTNNNPPAC